MSNPSNDQTDRAVTPAQQQHSAPSQPTSPLPKRFKPDPSLALNGTMADQATPTPENPPQTQPTTAATLPHISALLSDPSAPLNSAPMPMMSSVMPAPIPPLLIQKLSPSATTPTRGSAFAAGYDLYASAPTTIKSHNKALVSTSLAIAVPPGTYGRVAPRSGLASKHFLDTGAGVIDADYRGEVKVLMFNFSDVDYEVKQGERIAQLVLEKILTPEVVEVKTLEVSVRGAGGFGSTGQI